MRKFIVSIMSAAVLLSTSAAITGASAGPNPGIDFANMHGTIRDWKNDGNKALLIQGPGKQWYRAEFTNSCHALPFAEQIGFVTDGTNRIDRFSSIVVKGERCWFKSFAAVDAPTPKPKS